MITSQPFVRAAACLALGLAPAACISEPPMDPQVFEANGISFSGDLSELKEVETTRPFTVVINGDLDVSLVADVTWSSVAEAGDGGFTAHVFSDHSLGSDPAAPITGFESIAWKAGETDQFETFPTTIYCDEEPCEVGLALAMSWTSMSGASRGSARWRLRLSPRGEHADDLDFWISIRQDE